MDGRGGSAERHGLCIGQVMAESSVWVVEDEPAAAALAEEMCRAAGARATLFPDPRPFMEALRREPAPAAVVLDWRLVRELSAALFMATRRVHPGLPIVFWTASATDALPAMVRDDPSTRIVDKASGADAIEDAIAWALSVEPTPSPAGDAEE
jgi:DNA-binding NtrC family response regulator